MGISLLTYISPARGISSTDDVNLKPAIKPDRNQYIASKQENRIKKYVVATSKSNILKSLLLQGRFTLELSFN